MEKSFLDVCFLALPYGILLAVFAFFLAKKLATMCRKKAKRFGRMFYEDDSNVCTNCEKFLYRAEDARVIRLGKEPPHEVIRVEFGCFTEECPESKKKIIGTCDKELGERSMKLRSYKIDHLKAM